MTAFFREKLARSIGYAAYPYFFTPLFFAWTTGTTHLGHDLHEWMIFEIISGISFVSEILASRLIIGRNFHQKTIYHLATFFLITGTFFYGLTTHDSLLQMIRYIGFFVIGLSIAFMIIWEITLHINHLEQLAQSFSEGNFDYRVTSTPTLEDPIFGSLTKAFNGAGDLLQKLVNNLNLTEAVVHVTNNLGSIAEETAAAAQEVAAKSKSTSESVVDQKASINEMVSKLNQLNEGIQDITNQIQMNLNVLSKIAFKTSVLALNAGIEASRAGEYGKGFSVVANDIRKLSEVSKDAIEEIQTVSNEITERVKATFEDVFNLSSVQANFLENTSMATEQIAAAAIQTASAMEHLTELTMDLQDKANAVISFIEENNIRALYQRP